MVDWWRRRGYLKHAIASRCGEFLEGFFIFTAGGGHSFWHQIIDNLTLYKYALRIFFSKICRFFNNSQNMNFCAFLYFDISNFFSKTLERQFNAPQKSFSRQTCQLLIISRNMNFCCPYLLTFWMFLETKWR